MCPASGCDEEAGPRVDPSDSFLASQQQTNQDLNLDSTCVVARNGLGVDEPGRGGALPWSSDGGGPAETRPSLGHVRA